MQKLKKYLVVFALFIFILLGAGAAFIMYGNYADGYRVGTILKMSKKGVIFKTWEGELSQGFLESTQDAGSAGVGTKIWYFTAEDDDAIIQVMDKAIEGGHRVKLFFHEKYTSLPWIGETRNVVYQVEMVN